MRSDADVQSTIGRYSDMVFRICLVHLHNEADAEDVFQNVFLKYALCRNAFQSEEHKKAWLIRVTVNFCKSQLRSAWKSRVDLLPEDVEREDAPAGGSEVLEALRALDEKYRTVLYLHYYEGYKAAEIAKILRKRENTIYSLLARGRERLKEQLEGGVHV